MKYFVVLCLCVLAIACGGGNPGSPTPPVSAPSITTANTMIYIGQTVQFSATGSGTITWGGDAPGVATVDTPTGRVTGVSNGRVTIWAENAGGRTTRLLRSVPSYAGSWNGTYVITGCQSTLDFTTLVAFCNNFFNGQVLNIGLTISQTDDRVTGGSFALGQNQGGVINSVSLTDGGQFPITGLWTSGTGVNTAIQNGRFDSTAAGTISGTFDQNWTADALAGFGIISCQLRAITRTSGGPTVAGPRWEPVSLQEVMRRALVR